MKVVGLMPLQLIRSSYYSLLTTDNSLLTTHILSLSMSRISELEKLLEESPQDPFLLYALAREYEKAANTLQAILMYEHLVNQHPGYIATYYHYATLLYNAGNRTEGIKLLETGIKQGMEAREMHPVSEMKGLLMAWKEAD